MRQNNLFCTDETDQLDPASSCISAAMCAALHSWA